MRNTNIFGPVPSRRLGLSLGVDIVPFKLCPLDCIYCQLGPTTEKTIERKEYVSPEQVLTQLEEKLAEGSKADYITLSGSGEPTLNSKISQIIAGIKQLTEIPIAVLTNGVLMTDKQVRSDCSGADVILPSLDAGDQQTFQIVNHPHKHIDFQQVVKGLCELRAEFTGQIWLEVFLIEGLNTEPGQIEKIRQITQLINPDRIQLNTAVRPTTDKAAKRVEIEKLQQIAEKFGKNCEIIADFSRPDITAAEAVGEDITGSHTAQAHILETLLSILKRRPCTLDDIISALGTHRNEALKYLAHLQNQGLIETVEKNSQTFFKSL